MSCDLDFVIPGMLLRASTRSSLSVGAVLVSVLVSVGLLVLVTGSSTTLFFGFSSLGLSVLVSVCTGYFVSVGFSSESFVIISILESTVSSVSPSVASFDFVSVVQLYHDPH